MHKNAQRRRAEITLTSQLVDSCTLKPQPFASKLHWSCNKYRVNEPTNCILDHDVTPLKGKYHGVFDHFAKDGKIRPSLGYKIILEQREERNQLSSWKEQLVICSSAIWKQKYENLKNVSLNFFKFLSIPSYSVSHKKH